MRNLYSRCEEDFSWTKWFGWLLLTHDFTLLLCNLRIHKQHIVQFYLQTGLVWIYVYTVDAKEQQNCGIILTTTSTHLTCIFLPRMCLQSFICTLFDDWRQFFFKSLKLCIHGIGRVCFFSYLKDFNNLFFIKVSENYINS